MNKYWNFSILIVCLIYNFIVNSIYRPYIYSNKINDFGLADIGNNVTFIPGVFILFRLFGSKYIFSKNKDIIFHFCVLGFVEILSAFIPHMGTFDPKDLFGLFLGALITYFLFKNEKQSS